MQFANVNAFAQPILMQRQQQAQNAFAAYGQGMQRPQYPSVQQPTGAFAPAGGGDMAAKIRQGLIQRGLPAHVADGFVMNMRDESGLNPGVNEAKPIVPGSRGGYGLYQLTGPRRREYEAYAAQRGAALDDVDAQLDFLVQELGTTEASAAKHIMGASTAGEAAAAIVNKFLRPAEEHRTRRAARYLGSASKTPATPTEQFDPLAFLGL